MSDSDAAKKAQEERAKRLQKEIENPKPRPPKSPREFVDEKMRELEEKEKRKGKRA
jgi:hypothetical protein